MGMDRETVHIKVRPKRVDFGIHKDLLCHYSPCFKAAFTYGIEKTKTGVTKLPETDVEVFEIFNRWLYRNPLWSPDDYPDEQPGPDGEESGSLSNGWGYLNMEIFMRLYNFADETRIPSLMNQTLVDLKYVGDLAESVPTAAFLYSWNNVCDSSPIRRFIGN